MEEGVDDEPEGAHGDAAVRNVEYRIKESDVFPSNIGVYEREVEHIHYPSLKKRCVVPNHSVEDAVYYVSYGSGSDEGKGYEKAHRVVFLDKVTDPPDKDAREDYAESSEYVLAHYPAKGHSKRHSFVLYEGYPEPLANHGETLSNGHIGLDQDLCHLVNDEQYCSHYQKFLPL